MWPSLPRLAYARFVYPAGCTLEGGCKVQLQGERMLIHEETAESIANAATIPCKDCPNPSDAS